MQRWVSEMHVILVWLVWLAMVVFLFYKINFNFVKNRYIRILVVWIKASRKDVMLPVLKHTIGGGRKESCAKFYRDAKKSIVLFDGGKRADHAEIVFFFLGEYVLEGSVQNVLFVLHV
jgi:hypothetical protein